MKEAFNNLMYPLTEVLNCRATDKHAVESWAASKMVYTMSWKNAKMVEGSNGLNIEFFQLV